MPPQPPARPRPPAPGPHGSPGTASTPAITAPSPPPATDSAVLLLTLEFLWKSKPHAFASNDELAASTGWDERKVQRILEELERDGFIHRVLITGRADRVSGRTSATGRVAIIALVRLTDQPVTTKGKDLDQLVASIHRDIDRRQPLTVPFDRPVGARQIRHRLHDIPGEGCTTNLSSLLLDEEERQENTTTISNDSTGLSNMHECNRLSSSVLTLDPGPEQTQPHGVEALGGESVPQDPTAEVSAHDRARSPGDHGRKSGAGPRGTTGEPVGPVPGLDPSPAPIATPLAPAVLPMAAELVAVAAEAIPGASRAWLASLLRDCGGYGLDLALLVLAWVKIRRAEKPSRYARVALSGWLNKLRSGELTLEDVRAEVQGRTGVRNSPRPFDPKICLERMASLGWALVPHGPDRVMWTEIPGRGSPLWKTLPIDLRQEVEVHKAELKAHVLKRAAERGKTVAIRA